MTPDAGIALRRLAADEATAHRDRLRAIFRDAIRAAAPSRYDAAQVDAWAAGADDLEAWDRRTRARVIRVASHGDELVAVGSLDPLDHLDLLYVDPAWQRRGIATALVDALEDDARHAAVPVLVTDASLLAHPLFVRLGWQVAAWEEVARRGQVFRRARMRKALA